MPITHERLARVEGAEQGARLALQAAGHCVRDLGERARLEVDGALVARVDDQVLAASATQGSPRPRSSRSASARDR